MPKTVKRRKNKLAGRYRNRWPDEAEISGRMIPKWVADSCRNRWPDHPEICNWDRRFPGRIETMFNAIQNITPSHLMDHKLFDFKSINSSSGIIDGGDIAFDKQDIPAVPQSLAIEPDDRLEIIEIS